ncbi:MAG: ECF transporter S component [Firmicutes bacterium]|nr:ECF transporter S component [Bacillota bacterium]
MVAAALILLTIPLTIYFGYYFLGDRKYYFISLMIILQSMVPFVLVFEGRKPQARELVIIAVLCAIGVAGRTAFFMLPQFKPVAAIVIIAGVAFGGETGFLVGAVTAFVSNMFFGQGPWTPWQMFAFGIIGFVAGVLFKKGLLVRSRAALSVYGGLSAFVIYGGIMNPSIVLLYQSEPTLPMFLAAYLQGIPFDLVHAVATVLFLAVAARPMLEKLDRIKVKYGLIEE